MVNEKSKEFSKRRILLENNLMAMVGAFIGIAILLGIGTQILGNTVMDCTGFADYDSTATTQTGWSGSCEANNTAVQNAYALLMIVLIVISAVVILTVVKML